MSDQKQLDEIPRYIMTFTHAWPDPNGRWCAWEDVSALLAERDALLSLLRGIAGVRDCCDLDAFEAAEETRRQIDAALAGREGEG